MIVNMDPPEHADYRKLVNARFMPRGVALSAGLHRDGRGAIRSTPRRPKATPLFDLQDVVANPVPTAVISNYLGVPDDMAPLIHQWTVASLYPGDPESRRRVGPR
jgi:cytochrome P450